MVEKLCSWKLLRGAPKSFQDLFCFFGLFCLFFFAQTSSSGRFFLRVAVGAEARLCSLHLNYTSQRPCWFILILLCNDLYDIIINVMLLLLLFFQEGDIFVQFVYKWEIQAKSGLMMWNISGEKKKLFSIVRSTCSRALSHSNTTGLCGNEKEIPPWQSPLVGWRRSSGCF